MEGKVLLRVFAGLVLLGAIAGIGFMAFQAGAASHIQPATAGPVPAYGYPAWGFFPFWGFSPFGGFGCLGPLFAILLLFLAFRALGFLFWGPRWGWGRHHMHRGWREGWDHESGVPPMFREWHDRAHGQPSAPEAKQD